MLTHAEETRVQVQLGQFKVGAENDRSHKKESFLKGKERGTFFGSRSESKVEKHTQRVYFCPALITSSMGE